MSNRKSPIWFLKVSKLVPSWVPWKNYWMLCAQHKAASEVTVSFRTQQLLHVTVKPAKQVQLAWGFQDCSLGGWSQQFWASACIAMRSGSFKKADLGPSATKMDKSGIYSDSLPNSSCGWPVEFTAYGSCIGWIWFTWAQRWAWALEKSLMRPSFFPYFRETRKKRSHWPGGQSAQRLYNSYNLCPCARPAHVGECWPGPEFKFSKTVEVRWSC